MQSELQRVKVKFIVLDNDQFAIQHTALWQTPTQKVEQFREIAIERLFIAALNQYFVAISKHQDPKPIPLRFEAPISCIRKSIDTFADLGQQGRIARAVHP